MTTDYNRILPDKTCLTGLIIAIIVICFLGNFNRDLWTPDEPRVAAISLEMSRTGNLVIPYLADTPFIEKPPLYFIVTAGLIRSLGPTIGNTGAARLASILFALATLLVSFLLAKRLQGLEFAFLSLLILGTMGGFVENFHWLRVDTALTFFVVAALWCFAEAYQGKRAWFLPLAGVFAAGAFLSKGLIGPVLIAIPWTGLVLTGLRRPGKHTLTKDFLILPHLASLLIFGLLSGSWILLLRLTGGPGLWHEWFWVNQVGRLTGTAVKLGHLRPGRPFYYLIAAFLYSLPWVPLLGTWLGRLGKQLWRGKTITSANLFLLVWGVGTIILLSLSVTKRNVYLYPALPALAMMVSMAWQQGCPRWFTIYTSIWSILCITIMALITILPLAVTPFKSQLSPLLFNFLGSFGKANFIAAAALCASLVLFSNRRRLNLFFRFTAVTVLMYIVLFSGQLPAINQVKSMQAGTRKFVAQITKEKRRRIAGWNFSETMLANFYYYCNWSVPQIESEGRLRKILQHKDGQYDTIIINGTSSLEQLLKVPYRILAEGNPRNSRKTKRKVFWVEGNTVTQR